VPGVYLLPNLLTSVGLFCGTYSIVQTMKEAYFKAAIAILIALVFDALDGRVARMTKTESRFGVEYDSLCDLASFGLASGLLIYKWALIPWGIWGWLAIGLFVCCAALRLARFNTQVGMTPQGHFVGLPVPAAAVTLAGIVLVYRYLGGSGLPDKHVALLLVTYGLALLMVSTLPYPSFEQFKLHKRQPLWLLVAIVVGLMALVAYYRVLIFASISIYVLSGPVLWLWKRARGKRLSSGDSSGEDGGTMEAVE
jgi:CDP-diacylglycerol--serine O-phosphatidyltransferase